MIVESFSESLATEQKYLCLVGLTYGSEVAYLSAIYPLRIFSCYNLPF